MASESHSGPWVSGTFLGLLVGKGGEKRDSLGGSSESPFCSLMLRASLCSLALSLKWNNDPVRR